jgi:hypothetical protein
LVQGIVGTGSDGPVGAFDDEFGLDAPSVLGGDLVFHGGGNQNIHR